VNKTRRSLVFALGASALSVPLSSLTGVATAADVPKLDPKTGPANALGYRLESKDSSKVCTGCQFYTKATDEWGACLIFPGTHVAAKGTCNSWVQRSS
jgi:hypothetical protein